MVNYKNGLIYTIRTGDSVYVGSTCNFNRRKQSHKDCIYNKNKQPYNRKLYKTIRENGCEWDMKPHKEFPCENKTQLAIEEERVRVEMNADLNILSCYGFDGDYYKNYRQKNKDKLNQKNKDYYIKNKENKKQYRLNNIEVVKEKGKHHYEKNKEEILEKMKEKTICECGCKITKGGMTRHIKSAKHIKLMESKMENLVL